MAKIATAIHELLTPATVRVGLEGQSKEDVINALIDLLDGHPSVNDLDRVREAVWEREQVMSTGVGKELGLPHAKTSAVTETVAAFGVTAAPVDFGALDGQPVRLAFLLVGTEAAKSEHIRILSRLSRLISREALRERLLGAPSPEAVIEAFEETEHHLAKP